MVIASIFYSKKQLTKAVLSIYLGSGDEQVVPKVVSLVMLNLFLILYKVLLFLLRARSKRHPSLYHLHPWVNHRLHYTHKQLLRRCNHLHLPQKEVLGQCQPGERRINQ